MRKIILASGSPRRKDLLNDAGLDFVCMVSDADESTDLTNPAELVKELSRRKAEAVYERVINEYPDKDYIILGADTVVALNGQIMGKPEDETDAERMLKALSDNVHSVFTGVTLLYEEAGRKICDSFYDETKVIFYPVSDEEISLYVKTGEPMDKAGAYAIQGKAAKFIKRIEGDYANVVGLPVSLIYRKLIDHNPLHP